MPNRCSGKSIIGLRTRSSWSVSSRGCNPDAYPTQPRAALWKRCRLESMRSPSIHRRLYTSKNVQFVEMQAYLSGLVDDLLVTLQADGRKHPILLEAEPIHIPTDKAVAVGVIVTELVTNSFSRVSSGLKRYDPHLLKRAGSAGAVALVVEDDGKGWYGTGPVQGTGIGTEIVNAMARNLDTKVEFDLDHSGTRIVISFSV